MDKLVSILAPMIVFMYHCFDRVVIRGYLFSLSRPEQIVYFFKHIVGYECITKDILAERTKQYNLMIEEFAKNNNLPVEWAEDQRKQDYLRPYLEQMERDNQFGVYFILKSMEQGPAFRSVKPKHKTSDPNYRIVRKVRSRYTHYYFYIRDEVMGPMCVRVASFLPFETMYILNGHSFIEQKLKGAGISFKKEDNAFRSVEDPHALQDIADSLSPRIISQRLDYWTRIIGPRFSKRERELLDLQRFYSLSQVEYCHNLIFRRNFPITKLFERSCELSLFSVTASKISNIFGWRVTRLFRGQLQTCLESAEHGHHLFRAYFKNSFIKQYEKFRTYLRMEVCSNDVLNFRVKKSLDNLPVFRQKACQAIDRFASMQSNAFNTHFDFPLLADLSLPITCVNTRIAGIKIHDIRMIRLMETLMHSGDCLSGWTSAYIHETIVSNYALPDYTITQLRYDLRKMKSHGLVERNGNHYVYQLTEKGMRVSVMFLLFHKRLFGPLANSLFNHRPDPQNAFNSKLEKAYHKADTSIGKILDLLSPQNSERCALRVC